MFIYHFKTALRFFYRSKVTTLINLMGMTIGFASIMIIGNWVYYEFSFDGFHEYKDRIYRMIEKGSFKGQDEKYISLMPEWLIDTFEEEMNGVEAATGLLNIGTMRIGEGDKQVEVKNVTFTDNNIFKIFTFNFITGSAESALTMPKSVVITESVANKFSEGKSLVGQTILYENKKTYTITGVIEDIPDNSHFQSDMFISIEERKSEWSSDDSNHTTSIYLLLYDNIDPISLNESLQAHKNKYMPYDVESIEFQIQPLSDIHLFSKHTMWGQNWKKSDISLVYLFVVIGILILLISTINFINLSTASISKRFKEFGLRKMIGSSKTNLILQYLFESFLLLFASFCISLVMIEIFNPILIAKNILESSNYMYHQPWMFPAMLAVILILSILSGIYPAYILGSVKPITLFKRNIDASSRGITLRKILVVTQLSITCIMIISVLYMAKQILYMQGKELGYAKEAIINFWSGPAIRENYENIKSDLLAHSKIQDVTSSNVSLGRPMWRNCIHFEDEPVEDNWITPYMIVDYNYMNFYGIEIIEGREFSKEYALDRNKQAFLVNETLAKQMGGKNIVGRKFRTCNAYWGEIVGIVQDFNYRSLHHAVEPLAIQLGQDYNNMICVKTNDIQGTISLLEDTWNKYQPDQSFRYSFLDDSLNKLYNNEKRTARIGSIFCVISIILSCIGLLGMFLIITENKTKEIGVRKVNGASVKNILIILSKGLFINILIAFSISVPIGWLVINYWRGNFAYKTDISWWIFVAAGGAATLITLLTVSWQTIKAANRNPIEALRSE
ncbi:MAG: ABC transporter permease [Bacteroidota bacterium]